MHKKAINSRENLKFARQRWGEITKATKHSLKELTNRLSISIASGDLLLLDGKWYVTHAGLLRIATRRRCFSVTSNIEKDFSDAAASRWVFKATVFKSSKSKGFDGYGDADPSNVSSLVHGAELRIAEGRHPYIRCPIPVRDPHTGGGYAVLRPQMSHLDGEKRLTYKKREMDLA